MLLALALVPALISALILALILTLTRTLLWVLWGAFGSLRTPVPMLTSKGRPSRILSSALTLG